MRLPDLSNLVTPNAVIQVRVTPKASRNTIERDGDALRVYVTTVPEGGKANAAVVRLLSKALGVPKTRLTLIRGQTSRDKVFAVSKV